MQRQPPLRVERDAPTPARSREQRVIRAFTRDAITPSAATNATPPLAALATALG
jgi:hypothetical protein